MAASSIQEEAVAGPGRLIPAPLRDLVLHWRNNETLNRLEFLVEGLARARARGGAILGQGPHLTATRHRTGRDRMQPAYRGNTCPLGNEYEADCLRRIQAADR